MSLAWFLFAIFLALIFGFCYLLVKYYMDSTEKSRLVTFTVATSFTLGILCIFLVPVDVFALSQGQNGSNIVNRSSIGKFDLNLNIFMLLFAFIWIPFVYFFTELKEDKGDFDSDIQKPVARIIAAGRKTLTFVAVLAGLLTIGMIFRPGSSSHNSQSAWRNSMQGPHAGEYALLFCFGILTCGSLFLWIIHSSFGLACIPVFLIKGKKSLLESKNELRTDLVRIQQEYRAIQEKYAGSHSRITKEDQKMLAHLKKKELSLTVRNVQLDIDEDVKGFLPKAMRILRRFEKPLGFLCLFFSLLIFASILITTFDRAINSKCGFSCGFIVEEEHFLNPVDWLFVKSSKYFPLDYLFFSLFVFYCFMCSFFGTIKFGVKMMFKKYEIRKDSTLPNALLITGFMTCIMVLALSSQMITLSPQYASFGHQESFNRGTGMKSLCSLNKMTGDSSECQISNISSFFHKISLTMPLLGSLMFIGNFIFLILFGASFVHACRQEKRSRFESFELEMQPDDRESTRLLV